MSYKPQFAFSSRVSCCERCVFGTGEHSPFCLLALPSAVDKAQKPDGVRALKPGDHCEARVGRPSKWVDAVFDGFRGGIVFVTIVADQFELGLSWKDIRLKGVTKTQRPATPVQDAFSAWVPEPFSAETPVQRETANAEALDFYKPEVTV